jgi:glycosyltransferase involved in cell wall biosynthesis
MRVLRIIARLNVGGPARHVALLNAGLDARGHQTLLLYGALDEGEASMEAAARAAGIAMAQEPSLGRAVSAASDAAAFRAVLRHMFRFQPDVVHTHTAKAGTLGRSAALVYNITRRRRGKALVVHTFHGHVFEGYFSPLTSRLVQATERALARITDRIIAISPRQRHDIVDRFHIAPASKTWVVPLGLDLDALLTLSPGGPDLRAAIGAAADDIVVGYAGRLVPVKDLPTLLRAFASAWRAVPSLRLVLGGDGPLREELTALASALGVASRVQFLGWIEDLPRFYATLDLFALSSINEGTPVAVIEAMAAGRAVAATNVGGVPDVVEPGTTGMLVPSGDVNALAAALIDLASDRSRRQDLGKEGRRRAAARYSHLRLVDDIETLYVKALREKRGG